VSCVYTLQSALEPDAVRYVGRSTHDATDKRLRRHLSNAQNNQNTCYKNNWIRSVQSAGGEIIASVLESNLTHKESAEKEIFYIAYYKSLGCKLTNLTNGGEGSLGFIHSAETKARMSTMATGRTHSVETKEKLRIASAGRTHSAETRANMAISNSGRTMSVETKAKLLATHLGKKHSDETKAKMIAAWQKRKDRVMTGLTADEIAAL